MLWYGVTIILGAAVGSFVNVLAARTVAGKSVLVPRSFCDACAKPLLRRDMVPVISFLLLRARCRFCKAGISWQHPIIEIVTALLFLAAAFVTQGNAELLLFWIAIAVLVTLFITDLRAMVLPDPVTLPSIAVFLILGIMFLHRPLGSFLLAVVVGGMFFWLQHALSRGRWVGSGDIRFGLLMGAILGTWQLVIQALAVSYVLGAVISIPLLLTKKKKLKSEVPLGVFLAVGTLIVLFLPLVFPNIFT